MGEEADADWQEGLVEWGVADGRVRPKGCHGHQDGDCFWKNCPQTRDGEPARSGRHCPLDSREDT